MKLDTFAPGTKIGGRFGPRKNKIRKTKPKRDVILTGKYSVDPWNIVGHFLMDMPEPNVLRFVDADYPGLEVSYKCRMFFGRPHITKTDAKHLQRMSRKADKMFAEAEARHEEIYS